MKRTRRERLVRPAGGWPWEASGFKFYTDEMQAWLGGYVPQGLTPRTHDAGALTHTASMRAGQLQAIDVGRGFIGDLRPRSVEAVANNDRIRRSLSS